MHFSTFLKLLASDTARRIKEVDKYRDQSGGFDYWRPLRDGIARHCAGNNTRQDAISFIEGNCADSNRQNCLTKFDVVADWLGKPPRKAFQVPPRLLFRSPTGSFNVIVEPEIHFRTSSSNKVVSVYPTGSVSINADVAGAGIVLKRRCFGTMGDATFHVFDANKGRLFTAIPNVSERFLDASITDLDAHFASL